MYYVDMSSVCASSSIQPVIQDVPQVVESK
jgi:hypothetical protein